ncbi:Transcriptional regulator, AcrR family [Pseudomonas chlororaphis subsp. aurantiaca]|jgi:TetR/AcrR family transcriptional repressor of mexJK operon|uniref:TetR/AcrR family transcriptional regulator n=1 Tax=Pseudomonas chlororaphis subsp. aurantiaca TaxID=86192 RepID=A0AAJ0ZPS8_9PSED|nr:TetR/AcrR family transcriptional regulator [Pseudomonas chlororaphis]AIS14715.1 TetR family transcriptional regulator [Pseudomonas chlororaphis subsp. aurantiaca]AZD20483.1 Transcriptional regulator, AcrR family [Pseudomonas chlororaphis subsp. aurantiaca]AZD33941.1 Transcriptional regulator, AcrR family [Pseudomonas chlororaphis subsp. aurantiaca]AZD40274.1 Transcriptional regulator, AcrR family [Pseudomonas chlororaphis subsp. aurantiaca]AZD53044.1 Transcriptional regulator, AcrR family [
MSDNLSTSNGPGRPKDLAKRQAILEAAKTLFLSNGYANTSMDAVAAEAGVSKLTVYSHFNDKETLFSSAVMAKCEEQLPTLIFELPAGMPIESVLLNIARGFHLLINSEESLNLHRLIMALGSQDPKLSQIFFEAGPQRMLQGMERLLTRVDQSGALRIDKPRNAAEHFFCLLKGAANFRLLYGCGEPLSDEAAEEHVREVVGLFMRAYRPESA